MASLALLAISHNKRFMYLFPLQIRPFFFFPAFSLFLGQIPTQDENLSLLGGTQKNYRTASYLRLFQPATLRHLFRLSLERFVPSHLVLWERTKIEKSPLP